MGGYVSGKAFLEIDADGSGLEDMTADEISELDRIQIRPEALRKLPARIWHEVRERFLSVNPELGLRIYTSGRVDLGFLAEIPGLKKLSVEAREPICNTRALRELKNLRSLSLVLQGQTNIDFLQDVHSKIEALRVAKEGKGNIDLAPLQRFTELKRLGIAGCDKHLGTLFEHLPALEALALRSIAKPKSIDFVLNVPSLRELTVQLGGIRELDCLGSMQNLRYLQLWRIQKLANLDFVSKMRCLEYIALETLNSLDRFPSVELLANLRRVEITACKELRDFRALGASKSLTDFIFRDAKGQRPEDFVPLLANPLVVNLGIGFPRKRDQEEMAALMETHGKQGDTYLHPQFKTPFRGSK